MISKSAPPASEAQLRLFALSATASAIMHELMQPLCAASNYLCTSVVQLNDQDCSPEAIEGVERSAILVARAVDIIRGMRTFVIDGSARGRAVCLEEVVESVRSQFVGENRRPVEMTLSFGPDANMVVADELHIELAIRNLLANAIEIAGPLSTARIAIRSHRVGDQVVLSISDSGPGMTAEVHEKLFDPFFTTRDSGTGLGLAISKVIVEAHGGHIWAGSPSPSGATFYIALPAADRPDGVEGSTL
jgi:two-component system, LuxR family, sensor kinase FixL